MSKDLTEALDALTRHNRNTIGKPPKPRGAAPRQVSAGARIVSSGGSGTGAVVGDLKEKDINLREYHEGRWISSDGLFSFPAIKTVVMSDADGNEIKLIFAAP